MSENRPHTKLALWALLLSLAAAAAAVVLAMQFRLPLEDDSYISFRYARNIANGIGAVFNPGERVEGYSNPAWVWVMALCDALGLDIESSGSWLGILCSVATLLFIATYRLRQGAAAALSGLIAATLLACNPYVAYWAGKGMETPFYALCLTLGVLLLERRLRGEGGGGAWAFALSLAALTRPEGIAFCLFAAVVYGLYCKPRGEFRSLLIACLTLFVPFILFLLWRHYYYGEWLPNTYYAKVGGGLESRLRGLRYLKEAAENHPVLAIALALALVESIRQRRLSHFFVVSAVLGGLLMIVYEGGDHFFGYRMIVPFMPLLFVLSSSAIVDFAERRVPEPLWPRVGVFALVVTFAAGSAGVASAWKHGDIAKKLAGARPDMKARRLAGGCLRGIAAPNDWVTTPSLGLVSYASGLPTIDSLGLTDHHIARKKVPMGKGMHGHEKGDGLYLFERAPRFVLPRHSLSKGPKNFQQLKRSAWDRGTRDLVRLRDFPATYRVRNEPCAGRILNLFERIQ